MPVLEALQRRHSDVKLNTNVVNHQIGLAPPRSPELRRHSDVSPATIKELEKLKGGTKSTSTTSDGGGEWDSIKANVPSRIEIEPPTRVGSRRQSIRVSRQHSYDDDIQKNAIANMNADMEITLGLAPGQIPRRCLLVRRNFSCRKPNCPFRIAENRPMTSSAGSWFRRLRKRSFPISISRRPDHGAPHFAFPCRTTSRRMTRRAPTMDQLCWSTMTDEYDGADLNCKRTRCISLKKDKSWLSFPIRPDISALRERGVLGTNTSGPSLSVNPVNPYQGPGDYSIKSIGDWI